MARPGKPLREEARRLGWLKWRKHWPRFVVLVLVVAAMFVGAGQLLPHLSRELVGAAGATILSVTAYAFSFSGGQSFRDGAFGEEQTHRTLKPLRKEGWLMECNVRVKSGDVDLAVIAPTGVMAIESKYTNSHLRVTHDGVHELKWGGYCVNVYWPIAAALRSARRLQSIVLAVPGRVRTTVLPVVVLWGPRVEDVEGGAVVIDGVLVAVGRQSKDWIHRLKGEPLLEDEVERAWASVSTRKREHRSIPDDAAPDDAACH
jgi:hypothetical protein